LSLAESPDSPADDPTRADRRVELERQFRRARRWWLLILGVIILLPALAVVTPVAVKFVPEASRGLVARHFQKLVLDLETYAEEGNVDAAAATITRFSRGRGILTGREDSQLSQSSILEHFRFTQPEIILAHGERGALTVPEARFRQQVSIFFALVILEQEQEAMQKGREIIHSPQMPHGPHLSEDIRYLLYYLILQNDPEDRDFLEQRFQSSSVQTERINHDIVNPFVLTQNRIQQALAQAMVGDTSSVPGLVESHRADELFRLVEQHVPMLFWYYSQLTSELCLALSFELAGEYEAGSELLTDLNNAFFGYWRNAGQYYGSFGYAPAFGLPPQAGPARLAVPFAERLVELRIENHGHDSEQADQARFTLLSLYGLGALENKYRSLKFELSQRHDMGRWD